MDPSLLVDAMLNQAALRRASDIHLQPKDKRGEILFRVDGFLSEWMACSTDQLRAIISKLKYIAQMDIGEKRLPQDGSLEQTIRHQKLQLRLSTLPTIYGEKLVIRLFPQQQERLTLAQLGFSPAQFKLLQRMIQLPYGLFLVTGPTGSGKTTTMYKILEQLQEQKGRNICSLEDPVEIRLPALTQVQIRPEQGFTFAKGLRAILRQDPDIIFVGEIRDEETAEIAVRAALTGHLVLSTLHTPTPIGTIARLLEMGIKPYYLASALIGVMTQRLYRLSCPYCREGCYACFYTGYLGRSGVFEILPIRSELKTAIQKGADEGGLRQAVQSLRMSTLEDQMIRHVATGRTTDEERLNTCGHYHKERKQNV